MFTMSSLLSCILLASGLATLCIITPVSGIMCYQCNSHLHEGCSDVHINDTNSEYYKECNGTYEGQEPFCRKSVYELKSQPPRVIRGCGWHNHTLDCYHIDDSHHIEKICQCFTDACNQANKHTSVTATILVTTLALYLTA